MPEGFMYCLRKELVICDDVVRRRHDYHGVRISLEQCICRVSQAWCCISKLDNIELEFEDEAFRAIAHLAIERNTGARGLRSIIESILIKPMYELPSDKTVQKVVVTAKYVKGEEPITVIRGE